MTSRSKHMVVWVVIVVWAVNMVAPVVVKDYEPAAELNVGLIGILSLVLAVPSSNRTNRSDNPNSPEDSQMG